MLKYVIQETAQGYTGGNGYKGKNCFVAKLGLGEIYLSSRLATVAVGKLNDVVPAGFAIYPYVEVENCIIYIPSRDFLVEFGFKCNWQGCWVRTVENAEPFCNRQSLIWRTDMCGKLFFTMEENNHTVFTSFHGPTNEQDLRELMRILNWL